jgi:hypothetical protein
MTIKDEVANLQRLADTPADNTTTASKYIARYNARHAVVKHGSKTLILDETTTPISFQTIADFHNWYCNEWIEIKQQKLSLSKLWMKSKRRRQYTKIVFDPTDTNKNHYNLWKGFSVKPDSTKSCDKFLAHVRDNICSGIEAHYRWLMGWCAHMVQVPWEKPETAPVLKGEQGAGKGKMFVHYIGRLCAEHYVCVSQASHVTGRFNSHHQNCLLLFADEAFWAGDKQAEGTLKHFITDHELMIEGKNKDAFMVKNISRLIVASNSEWVVPTDIDARRWAVFDVSNKHCNDREYFGAIADEMANGGLEALMDYLLHFDLSSVDIHSVPKTAALLDQKELSFKPHEAWWKECLDEGSITGGVVWLEEMDKKAIWKSYQQWAEDHNIRGRLLPDIHIHRWLKQHKLIPDMREVRSNDSGNRVRRIVLPELQVCRDAFARYLKQPIEWEVSPIPTTRPNRFDGVT